MVIGILHFIERVLLLEHHGLVHSTEGLSFLLNEILTIARENVNGFRVVDTLLRLLVREDLGIFD